ncbi:4-hydroxythreonine-4-phosphate dehydrogenase [Novosphingobium chloroacetimidivorans]|uniref:4-hydroxythreonine-4-phosphate dehydrogenase n=1 Tax=Novosphingobium chloroacetimidivorans TaxID=1428314 RepID=A0A7W7KCT4_9SPHN|nr:4-hydroxythreonine-4-phosphate dehydrogenase PdxA [Novosphingobium chloroacetimidivorans]MBB4860455.1 4-hydroxythreonine-4-phosphate dehydrogenase [Novosphingobium chloroacetimidivorans]
MTALPPLAVSLGDPAGVGPELIAEAWVRRDVERLLPFIVSGGRSVIEAAARRRGLSVPLIAIADASEATAAFAQGLPILGEHDAEYRPGMPDEQGALLAIASLTQAAALSVAGEASAIVTGPIAKSHLARHGFTQPGQTEFVADASGTPREDAVMMLAGPSLRTVPLTVHTALAQVPSLLSVDLIVRRVRVVAASLARDFGLPEPRIAVTGLNPHAGEDGRMGLEERDVIAPALDILRASGLAVTGPHPADALFAAHERGRYDVAVCMYHDQALIPIKTLDFDQGVNVTLGLPVVRTSPDHGTAFAIAGTGTASAGATIAAIRMAGECAERRARVLAG